MKAPFFQTIQAFLTNLVTKRQLRAVELILKPCCKAGIASVVFTCTATHVATVVVTLKQPINFLGLGSAELFSSTGTKFLGTGTFDGTVITVTGAPVPTTGATNITGKLFLPTNQSDSTLGIFISLTSFASTIPNCT